MVMFPRYESDKQSGVEWLGEISRLLSPEPVTDEIVLHKLEEVRW